MKKILFLALAVALVLVSCGDGTPAGGGNGGGRASQGAPIFITARLRPSLRRRSFPKPPRWTWAGVIS